jgi:hypothetical protein
MKPTKRSNGRLTPSPRAAKILKSLRAARRTAVKTAKLHGVPIIYMRDGKIVRERP